MLEITGEHISKLGDEDLRVLVVRLCEAELRKLNLPLAAVTAGGHQNAADGGLDVRVELPSSSTELDFIPRAVTGFQVKQQDMPAGAIDAEMKPDGNLRPSILNLAATQGAYVIISGLGSTADSALTKRKEAMLLATTGLPQGAKLYLDFYDRDRLARWVRCYPGVALWLRERIGEPLAGWRPYGNWAYGDPINSEYLLDDKCRIVTPQHADGNSSLTVEEGIQEIRSVLANPGGIVRLIGLSGTGKTRLVQALFDGRIGNDVLDRSVVIYVDQGSDLPPTPSAGDMIHRLAVDGLRAIVVVDNCNPAMHRNLAQAIGLSGGVVSLITVEYDVSDDEPEETHVFRLEPASEKIIEEIIRRIAPAVSQTDLSRIAEFSGGNARVALALARTVEKSGSLAALNDVELFKRLFEQRKGSGESLMKAAEVCSLVYSFDGENIEGDASELHVLAGLAEMSAIELFRHIGELRNRDLVQRRSKWRAVLPHAVSNRLASQALEKIPMAVLTNTFVQSGGDRLLKSFSRRLGYLHASDHAKRIAEAWMSSGGFLGNLPRLNELGIEMFNNVAPLSPRVALQAIEGAASGDDGKQFLTAESYSSWQWSNLLRSIAYEPEYFGRAVLLLARHAAENAGAQNNSSTSDSFKELFHLHLSGTHALVDARLDVVRQLLESDKKAFNTCGLEALNAMLESWHFGSSHDFTFGGMHRDFGWEPKTGADTSAWYRQVVGFCQTQVQSNSPHTAEIRQLLALHFRGLWLQAGICDVLEEIARNFAVEDGWPDGWLAVLNTIGFDSKNMSPEFANRTRALEVELRPTNLYQKIQAYILSDKRAHFDFLDADLDRDDAETHEKSWERMNILVEDLGVEAASKPDVLVPLLPQLLTVGNRMAWQFGRGIAKGTKDVESVWLHFRNVLATLSKGESDISLLRGFIEAISTNDMDIVNQLMDKAVADPVLAPYFPMLQSAYQFDAVGARRVIASLERGQAKSLEYSCLAYGGVSNATPLPLLREILLALASRTDGYRVAIDIFAMRIHALKSSKSEIANEIAAVGRELLRHESFSSKDHNHPYRIKEIASVCMIGEIAYKDALIICSNLAKSLFDYRSEARLYEPLAAILFQLQPDAAIFVFLEKNLYQGGSWFEQLSARFRKLNSVAKALLKGRTTKSCYKPFSYNFTSLRHESPVNSAAPEKLLAWAAKKPETNFPILAEEIHLFKKSGEHDSLVWSQIALEILECTPDRTAILDIYATKLYPRGWSGSRADAFSPYLALVKQLQSHNDEQVASWARKQADFLSKLMDDERKLDRCVDESFE